MRKRDEREMRYGHEKKRMCLRKVLFCGSLVLSTRSLLTLLPLPFTLRTILLLVHFRLLDLSLPPGDNLYRLISQLFLSPSRPFISRRIYPGR